MKEKIKRFFIEKKELLIFVSIVALVFAGVITLASLALNNTQTAGGNNLEPTSMTEPSSSSTSSSDPGSSPSSSFNMSIGLPIVGDYVVVRTYFDTSLSKEELSKAVINTGTSYKESQGISYAKKDNSQFEVYAICDGVVTDVKSDPLEGNVVTIKHDNNMVSVYSALSNVLVSKGDKVSSLTVLGNSGTSILDNESGVHVHLEVLVSGVHVNPSSVIGKHLSEVSSTK